MIRDAIESLNCFYYIFCYGFYYFIGFYICHTLSLVLDSLTINWIAMFFWYAGLNFVPVRRRKWFWFILQLFSKKRIKYLLINFDWMDIDFEHFNWSIFHLEVASIFIYTPMNIGIYIPVHKNTHTHTHNSFEIQNSHLVKKKKTTTKYIWNIRKVI